jgi:hypothetical protein
MPTLRAVAGPDDATIGGTTVNPSTFSRIVPCEPRWSRTRAWRVIPPSVASAPDRSGTQTGVLQVIVELTVA